MIEILMYHCTCTLIVGNVVLTQDMCRKAVTFSGGSLVGEQVVMVEVVAL